MNKAGLVLLLSVLATFSQTNTWTRVADYTLGTRSRPALAYVPEHQGFLLSMGVLADSAQMYSEALYKPSLGHWINFLPGANLYGIWADSTGKPYGNGLTTDGVFGSPYFIFKIIPYSSTQYLRPALVRYQTASYAYYQFAYNTDDQKVYYYMKNWTFTYDTQTRRWDTLTTTGNPATYQGGSSSLMWGSLCYDAVNQEIVLFGGGAVDAENGQTGTWTFNPTSKTWTKLNLAVQPPPRALSQMVYDAKNQVIVMFGGDRLDLLYSDTWVYQCATRTWVKKNPARCPSPRAGHGFVYLPKSQKVVLVAGYNYPQATTYQGSQYQNLSPFDLWTYDAAADEWKLIKAFASGDVKPNFGNGSHPYPAIIAADTGDRILALANDGPMVDYEVQPSTYLLTCDPTQTDANGTQTYGVSPGTLGRRAGPYDPAWYTNVPAANPDSFRLALKNLPTNQWIKVTPPKNPNGASTILDRVWGTRIIDPDRDQIYIWAGGHSSHGGTDVARYEIGNNRWYIDQFGDWPMEGTYSNTTYPPYFTFNNRPFMTGHTYDNYDYDVHLKKMVLVKQKYSYVYNPDARDWDSLRILNHAEMGGGFYSTSVTSTPYGVVCWTYKTGQSSSVAPYLLFLLDSVTHTWKKLNTTGDVVPVYYTDFDGAVFDTKRNRLLFHTKSSNPGQVYSLNIQTLQFTKLNPTGSIGGDSYFRESAYLPAQDKVLIQGNRIYNCATNAWETPSITKGNGVGTTSSVNSGYMYDAKRDLIWDCENPDLYVLRLSGGINLDSLPALRVGTARAVPKYFFSASPNPSHHRLTFGFFVGEEGRVSLKIYAVGGRLVRALTGKPAQGPVAQYWNWDGRDGSGQEAPAGVYVAVLKAGAVQKQVKFTRVR